MAAQAFVTFRQARHPSPAKLLAVLIIVLSVTGVSLAAFMLTRTNLATRSHATPQVMQTRLTSTHRTQPRPQR